MAGPLVIWDLEDDPDGNIAHLAEHGIAPEEVEEVLSDPNASHTVSRSSGRPMVFGPTSTGKYIAVVYEDVEEDVVYPVTAYETQPPGGSP